MDVARLKSEAALCSSRLGRLRDLAAQLAQDHTHQGESERRSNECVEPAASPANAADRDRVRLRRVTRDMLAGASQARSSMAHAFVLSSDDAIAAAPAVLPDLRAMAERSPQQLSTRSGVSIPAHARTARSSVAPWLAVIGVFITALGAGVMRVRDHTTRVASRGHMVQQHTGVHAPDSALPGRTRGTSPLFVMAEKGPAGTINGTLDTVGINAQVQPAAGASLDARSQGVVRPAAHVVGTTGSHWVPSTKSRTAAAGILRESRTAQRFSGDLRVESLPSGAAVFIDQRPAGRTPLQIRGLHAGSHVVRIEHDGYERWTTAAVVPTDQQTRVRAKLSPAGAENLGQ
jgi:hypothetical protein